MANPYSVTRSDITLRLTLVPPVTRGAGFRIVAERETPQGLVPFGFQSTHQVGTVITNAFAPETIGGSPHFMDGIRIDERFRGRGLGSILVDGTVAAFTEFGGTHLAGLTENEARLAARYLAHDYVPVRPYRSFGTDTVDMVEQWFVRSYGPLRHKT